jgi:hypothetical protein
MKIKFTVSLLLFLVSSAIIYAQNKLIIFNKEGQIIKSFGETNGNSFQDCYHRGFRLVIEDVDPADQKKYYLIYQARKSDYIYGSNLTSFERLIEPFVYNANENILELNLHKRLLREVISYQLVKTNEWGTDKDKFEAMVLSSNWADHYSDEIKLKENLVTYLGNNFFNTYKEVLAFNDSCDRYKTMKAAFDKNKYLLSANAKTKIEEKEKVKNEIDILGKKLEKITSLSRSDNVVSSFDALNADLIRLNKKLIDLDKELLEFKDKDSIYLNKLGSICRKARERLRFDFHKENFVKQEKYTDAAPYEILHQGTLINATSKTKEVVYTAFQQDIFNSGKKNLSVKRLSPDLPQLTTDDELYIKLVNIEYKLLKENPFLFQINIDNSKTATEAELANGPLIKDMDKIDESIFSNIVGMTASKSPTVSMKSFAKDFAGYVAPPNPYLDWYTKINSATDPTLQEVAGWNNLQEKMDALNAADKNPASKKLYIEAKAKLQQFTEVFVAFTNLMYAEIIPQKNEEPKYLDFLLKNDKPFQYATKPVIELKSSNFVTSDYSLAVSDGTPKKPTFTVKSEISSLIKDELAPVRKRYLFNVNAGVVWTPIQSYTYSQELISGSQTSYQLVEKGTMENKFVPTLFFSTYLGGNDIYEKLSKSNWYHRLHIDVGIDYADTQLLDNFYFGGGFEPVRTLHIVGGVRIGNVTRVNMNQVDPVTFDLSNAQEKTLDYQPYFGVSLGFNLIPMAIKSLITK